MPSSASKKASSTKSKLTTKKSIDGNNNPHQQITNDKSEDANGETNSDSDSSSDSTTGSEDIISVLNKRSAKLNPVSCISFRFKAYLTKGSFI
jgi:hypothetical protein